MSGDPSDAAPSPEHPMDPLPDTHGCIPAGPGEPCPDRDDVPILIDPEEETKGVALPPVGFQYSLPYMHRWARDLVHGSNGLQGNPVNDVPQFGPLQFPRILGEWLARDRAIRSHVCEDVDDMADQVRATSRDYEETEEMLAQAFRERERTLM